jgi:predicted N-acetyltransferase YhbS
MDIRITVVSKLSQEQEKVVKELQQAAFSDVSQTEVDEDFYVPKDAYIFAFFNDEIVGMAQICHSEVEFEGKKIKLGGIAGVITRSDWWRKGIATKVCQTGMEYLKGRGDDLVFLSVDVSKGTYGFYEKLGFVMLPRNFSWTNSQGQLKESGGGMIASVNSEEVFGQVLNGKDTFYVGNGYW